ncbi:HAD family phosphatase [Sporolactobacillus sp. THM7-4]|nr:HAD family phosphatase [Sporolactobacillus sp. THM7-4]
MCVLKMIAIDLDGTLLNSKKRISPENLEALKRTVENHHLVTIVTGRNIMDVRAFLNHAVSLPIIASNGATVYDRDGTLLSETPLDHEQAEEIIHYALEHGVYFEVTTKDSLLSPVTGEEILRNEIAKKKLMNPLTDTELLWQSAAAQLSQVSLRPTENMKAILTKEKPIFKVLIASFFPNTLDRFKILFADRQAITCTSSAASTVEFISSKIDKGKAICNLARKYGIKNEDIVVIGDSPNDLSMFREAGVRIAMGNAIPSIKAISTMITRDCEQNGVAYALKNQLSLYAQPK